jgi:hypothetical protein
MLEFLFLCRVGVNLRPCPLGAFYGQECVHLGRDFDLSGIALNLPRWNLEFLGCTPR